MKREFKVSIVRDLILRVFELNGLLIETGNRLVHPAELTSALWQVLAALGYSKKPLTVAQIAKQMGVSRQGIQRAVNELVKRDFVIYQVNPHHQRSKLAVLTKAGFLALKAAEDAEAPLSRLLYEQLGAERIVAANILLKDMRNVITSAELKQKTATSKRVES